MTVFAVIGIAGLLALILSLVADGLLDGLLPDIDGGGGLSLPAIAGFCAAFGFGGVLATANGASPLVASGFGVLAGLVVGGGAFFGMRAMQGAESPESAVSESAVGTHGVVLTTIPADGYGTIRIRLGGHSTPMNATSDQEIKTGAPIVVAAALSPTAVKVNPAEPNTDQQ